MDDIQQERKPWLIINGVKNSSDTNDGALIKREVEKILEGSTNLPKIIDVHRIGRDNYEARPIVVKLESMAEKVCVLKKRKGLQTSNIKVMGYLTQERLNLLQRCKDIINESDFEGYCFADYEGNIKLKTFNPMMRGRTYFNIGDEMELLNLINNNISKSINKYEKSVEQRLSLAAYQKDDKLGVVIHE